mmetsp:Transcript_27741/g.77569  ORF Transcript_27741/g.77569 Transcript_27741/m.77569 type:complete len:222 (-) Transcript_27741:1445-2110(-)
MSRSALWARRNGLVVRECTITKTRSSSEHWLDAMAFLTALLAKAVAFCPAPPEMKWKASASIPTTADSSSSPVAFSRGSVGGWSMLMSPRGRRNATVARSSNRNEFTNSPVTLNISSKPTFRSAPVTEFVRERAETRGEGMYPVSVSSCVSEMRKRTCRIWIKPSSPLDPRASNHPPDLRDNTVSTSFSAKAPNFSPSPRVSFSFGLVTTASHAFAFSHAL